MFLYDDWDRQKRARNAVPVAPFGPAPKGGTLYGRKALADEAARLAATPEGGRNGQLNESAFAVGQLVAAGHVDRDEAVLCIRDAALSTGLGPREVNSTFGSGFAAGLATPRENMPDPHADRLSVASLIADLRRLPPASRTPVNTPTTDEASDAAEPAASVTTLAGVTPERVRWLWPGRLPVGKLVVIDGDPSAGKSTMTLDLAARLSGGGVWPDGVPVGEPGDVLVMSAEDGLADTIVPRLCAAGADLTRVHALTDVMVWADGEARRVAPSLPRDVGILRDEIARRHVRLVIVDVLMAFLSGKVDAHRDQDVRGVLHQLAAVADETGATIILLRHLNKSGGPNALYRGGGSIGIVGAARAGFLVARDPDDDQRRILAVIKSNLAAAPPSLAYRLVDAPEYGCARIEWEDEPTGLTADELLRSPIDDSERSERDEAVEFLTEYLTPIGGEALARDVIKAAAAVGINRETLRRARVRAGVVTRKAGMGGGWVWSIDPNAGAEEHTKNTKDTGQ